MSPTLCWRMAGLLGIFAAFLLSVNAFYTTLEIISIANMNSSGPVQTNFRVKRVSGSMFGVSGTFSLAADYQRLKAGARMYFASKPGAPYRQWPFNQQAKPICTQINDFYVKYVMNDMANCSDLPQVDKPGPKVCNMLAGKTFTLRNYLFDQEKISQNTQAGMYRLEVIIIDGQQLVSGVEIVVRLS